MIEYILLAIKDEITKVVAGDQSTAGVVPDHGSPLNKYATFNQRTDMMLSKVDNQREKSSDYNPFQEDPLQPRPADWARILEAATQRRTEVLAPENLENMWTKGRNYKRKEHKKKIRATQEHTPHTPVSSGVDSAVPARKLGNEMVADRHEISTGIEDKSIVKLTRETSLDSQLSDGTKKEMQFSLDPSKKSYAEGGNLVDELEDIGSLAADGNKSRLKRSNSTSALKIQPDTKRALTEGGGSIISEFYSPEFGRRREEHVGKSASDMVVHYVGQQVPKLRCRVSIFSVKFDGLADINFGNGLADIVSIEDVNNFSFLTLCPICLYRLWAHTLRNLGQNLLQFIQLQLQIQKTELGL